MKEVKAPLAKVNPKEVKVIDKKDNKAGKIIISSAVLVGLALIVKKIINKVNSRKEKFKVYKVAKT